MKKILIGTMCCSLMVPVISEAAGLGKLGGIAKKKNKVESVQAVANQAVELTWLVTGDAKAEKAIGEKSYQAYLSQNNKSTNKEYLTRANEIFKKLLPQYNKLNNLEPTIDVIQGNEVNAFVIPGAHVFIYEGMFKFAKNDDEIAAVLGHELAHADCQHLLKKSRKSEVIKTLIEKAFKGNGDKQAIAGIAAEFLEMKFSRDDEREADNKGLKSISAVGYDPYSQVDFWERMEMAESQGEGNPNGLFGSIGLVLGNLTKLANSHPTSAERKSNAMKLINQLKRNKK